MCCAGGGGKCLEFAAKWFTFTFPEKTAKRAVESIFSRGKCLGFVEIWFTFPEKKRRNGGKINISGGKVPQIRGKMVHFPGEEQTRNEHSGYG